ncbi:preprotein translocase subunit SECE1 [Diospyros lotus]|uniref:preprotein translocase subunit SECE1 n=1 Tax=Diospyros lotus TaxID=55363 RepID=UPI00225B1B7C|nr:preprotein translocase subunit SECE1 [Diospyros lotus]
MAIQISFGSPILSYPPKPYSNIRIKSTSISTKPSKITISTRTRTTPFTIRATAAGEEEKEEKPQRTDNSVAEPRPVITQQGTPNEPPPPQQQQSASTEIGGISELGSEIKKAMKEREKEEESLWSGVAKEIREIEWPAFGKVLGTTGVVLGVIAGSSVVLLTVNAILAELSDRVFAGKGVQDFFG